MVTQVVAEDPEKSLMLCEDLLSREPDERELIESAVRVGDVLALKLEYYYTQSQLDKAYLVLEDMRARRLVPTQYVDGLVIDNIERELGRGPEPSTVDEGGSSKNLEQSDESVREEISDDDNDDDDGDGGDEGAGGQALWPSTSGSRLLGTTSLRA